MVAEESPAQGFGALPPDVAKAILFFPDQHFPECTDGRCKGVVGRAIRCLSPGDEKMEKHRKPQKSNPHRLTVNQHVLPVKSIALFADARGTVTLCDTAHGIVRRAKPKDVVFCARRAWDQRAELGYMKQIEDTFQPLASGIIEGTVTSISEADRRIVNTFYSLWYFRARHRHLPVQGIQMNGVTGCNFPPDQDELLEKRGVLFLRAGGVMPARHINAIQMQVKLFRYAFDQMGKLEWGIVRPLEGEFIVPDVTEHYIMPISPTVALVANVPNGFVTAQNLAEINTALQLGSQDYFFARDFNRCPIAPGLGRGKPAGGTI